MEFSSGCFDAFFKKDFRSDSSVKNKIQKAALFELTPASTQPNFDSKQKRR